MKIVSKSSKVFNLQMELTEEDVKHILIGLFENSSGLIKNHPGIAEFHDALMAATGVKRLNGIFDERMSKRLDRK